MKPDRALFAALVVALLSSPARAQEGTKTPSLQDARRDFKTRLVRTERDKEPLPEPADPAFSLVRYRGPLGEMAAWLSRAPEPGKKLPAIVWITGGTLALLVAAAADPERIRAVFAFGPVANTADYGAESLTYDPTDEKENHLRSPLRFLGSIRTPTFVIEGSRGNFLPLLALRSANKNAAVRILEVKNSDHFQILTPANRLIAKKIVSNEPVDLKADELQSAFDAHQVAVREAGDLSILAAARRNGVDLRQPQPVRYYFYAEARKPLEEAAAGAKQEGFEPGEVKEQKDEDGAVYYELVVRKRMSLLELDKVFAASAALSRIARERKVDYSGWEVGD